VAQKPQLIALPALVLIGLALSSCKPSASAIQVALEGTIASWTEVPSQTSLPTCIPVPTVAIEVTRLVVVTATSSPTPVSSPTITLTPTSSYTPTRTSTPTRTPNATQTAQARLMERLTAPKSDGFYLVDVDIAPGVWRSTGTGDSCYWEITTRSGDIINNHFGLSGGTAYIAASAFQVRFQDCGQWVFLSPP
jgi:hypothetical protein